MAGALSAPTRRARLFARGYATGTIEVDSVFYVGLVLVSQRPRTRLIDGAASVADGYSVLRTAGAYDIADCAGVDASALPDRGNASAAVEIHRCPGGNLGCRIVGCRSYFNAIPAVCAA